MIIIMIIIIIIADVESVEGMKANLIEVIGSVTLLGEMNAAHKVGVSPIIPEMDHLLCFVPGMLALGSIELDRPEDLELAKELLSTCYMLYADQEAGIGPEKVRFEKNPSSDTGKPSYHILSGAYYLRPGSRPNLFEWSPAHG